MKEEEETEANNKQQSDDYDESTLVLPLFMSRPLKIRWFWSNVEVKEENKEELEKKISKSSVEWQSWKRHDVKISSASY